MENSISDDACNPAFRGKDAAFILDWIDDMFLFYAESPEAVARMESIICYFESLFGVDIDYMSKDQLLLVAEMLLFLE